MSPHRPASVTVPSGKPEVFDVQEGLYKRLCIGCVVQDAIEDSSAGFYDLARDTDKGVEEASELHAQDLF